MAYRLDDTIAAISTPIGASGIGIVRLSGPEALAIADLLFVPARRGRRPATQETYTVSFGHVVVSGEVVDQAILTVMRGPRSYTTQDVVEINCHGGIVPLRRTLEATLAAGARLADPGEFTRRAFAFGRIDLAQAEAVADVINARTTAAQRAAGAQLEGALSQRVEQLRVQAVELLAQLEAQLDFGDHDVEPAAGEQIDATLAALAAELAALLERADAGRALREGLQVAIIGRPNVGKSSLLNALLGEERAIVTPIPGTTRDVISEGLAIAGVPVTLFDTAGMREAADEIERAGVQRSERARRQADLVLLVLDGSDELHPEDHELLSRADARTVLLVNKCDLAQRVDLSAEQAAPALWLSALTGVGLDGLRTEIGRRVWGGETEPAGEVLVTNVRHQQALAGAARAVEEAREAIRRGLTEEYVAQSLREALERLGEIGGRTLSEEIVDRIFERFCIGK